MYVFKCIWWPRGARSESICVEVRLATNHVCRSFVQVTANLFGSVYSYCSLHYQFRSFGVGCGSIIRLACTSAWSSLLEPCLAASGQLLTVCTYDSLRCCQIQMDKRPSWRERSVSCLACLLLESTLAKMYHLLDALIGPLQTDKQNNDLQSTSVDMTIFDVECARLARSRSLLQVWLRLSQSIRLPSIDKDNS